MQRAKTFFFVCAGLFVLVLTYHVGARNVAAQAGGQEVAVLNGEVGDGGIIPLPHYADGTQAQETECYWTVAPKVLSLAESNWVPTFQRCSTEGRTVHVYWCQGRCTIAGDCIPPASGCPPTASPGTATFLIIAVRNSSPISTRQESFGTVKARYR
jgi:hypothetical protein